MNSQFKIIYFKLDWNRILLLLWIREIFIDSWKIFYYKILNKDIILQLYLNICIETNVLVKETERVAEEFGLIRLWMSLMLKV